MKIAVLGTGTVGQTFAEKLTGLGHQVTIGTRNAEETKGREAFKGWHAKNQSVLVSSFAEAAESGELILNALKGEAAIEVFKAIASSVLDNKVVIDISNPLDFSKGFPPFLTEGLNNSYSLGEALQQLIPRAKVVKTLNTMWCGLMVNPNLINQGNHTNFICGNDSAAKEKVKELLRQLGWKNENILDLGDISNARGTEGILPLWTRIYAATGTGAFNIQVVK